jgi:hypothetical protein
MNDFRIWLQWAVIRAQSYRLPGLMLRWVCRVGTWRVGQRLVAISGVEAVYARHTHPKSPSFVPGHSDLDLTVVLSDRAAGNPEAAFAVARFLERRRLFYYYLSPDDARITSAGELARMTRKWPPVEILVGPENWTLLAGRDVRQEKSLILPHTQITNHPEFNRWWGHILQDYLLRTLPGEENRYHRVFYRGTIKQVAYFMVARGMTPATPESFTGQGMAQCVLDNHPDLRTMLEDLEKNDFWASEEMNLRERIFHEVLRITSEFHTGSGLKPKPTREWRPHPEDSGLHTNAYDALAVKLGTFPELKSRLAGVLVYPTPHCHPYFYQADLLLPDDISLAEFITVTEQIRQSFEGRGIESEGHHYAISLVPVGVSGMPLVYRGSPFPFLVEHIERYGRMLFGPAGVVEKPDEVARQPDRQDLVNWCRIFLPYFTSNLARRIEHSSRTLNFCHIAAVSLFLETGEIVTDSTFLPARHQVVFGKDSPTDEQWEYLLRDKPGREPHELYRIAAKHLQSELARVERLLDEKESQVAFVSGESSLR